MVQILWAGSGHRYARVHRLKSETYPERVRHHLHPSSVSYSFLSSHCHAGTGLLALYQKTLLAPYLVNKRPRFRHLSNYIAHCDSSHPQGRSHLLPEFPGYFRPPPGKTNKAPSTVKLNPHHLLLARRPACQRISSIATSCSRSSPDHLSR